MMGHFLNPGNKEFRLILGGRYIDKTGLIAEFDSTLGSASTLVLSTRPRRFGKTYAAKALAAFYSRGCDSRELFCNLEVSRHENWDRNLNRLNVVYLDMSKVTEVARSSNIAVTLNEMPLVELAEQYPDAVATSTGRGDPLCDAILSVAKSTSTKFVFIIDEWDAPYRLLEDDADATDAYASWLRSIFKDITFTPDAIAGAFMTGILPINQPSPTSENTRWSNRASMRPSSASQKKRWSNLR